ncbi:response regulator [Methylotuvimicrobium buryatense]|uniref:Response regulator n=2 Tax=Methylotuvimicrobium buryatense TaxID=95641 RepID=A0A4P9URD7_METBY|nr:response regulator [Methylotuvimicrobium buryatense]QCW84049.1 response regulator [Methylotuvimicrobium buryatense]
MSNLAQTGMLFAEYQAVRNNYAKQALIEPPQKISMTQSLNRIKISALIGLVSTLAAGLVALAAYRRLKQNDRSGNTNEIGGSVTVRPPPWNKTNPEEQSKHSISPHKFSILIADDNSINRLLLVNQLQDHCEQIIATKDGIEAFNYLKSERFNLVFLDLQMPGHNGFELIETIRHTENPNKDTPIVAVTAHALPSQCQDIIALGFDECLIKPILAEQLEEIVALWRPDSPREALSDSLNLSGSLKQTGYAQQLLAKTAYDRELALTILNKLCEELPQQLASIQTSLRHRQWQQALSVTHKLHGSVSFCGLTDIRQLALTLEQNLISKNFLETERHFDKLKALIEQFIRKKTELIEELSNKYSV